MTFQLKLDRVSAGQLLVFQLNPHREGRALSGRGLDGVRAAKNARARDALQAKPGARPRVTISQEAMSIVADCELELARVYAAFLISARVAPECLRMLLIPSCTMR